MLREGITTHSEQKRIDKMREERTEIATRIGMLDSEKRFMQDKAGDTHKSHARLFSIGD